MFNFLNSTVLFAAVAALIPLIIHLFSKRKVKIIEFSSLKHLKAMQRRQVRKLKIRQLLLLLLRMLIILLVVLAFARPTTESGNIGSHASVSAVILFDNSASMNRYVSDGNLFDIAKKRTKELLETFGEGDEVALIPLVKSYYIEEGQLFTSAVVAEENLERIQYGYGKAELENALNKAVNLLYQATNLNKEIYLISDRQRYTLPDTNILKDNDANFYFINLPLEINENCGITSVDFGGQLILPGHDFVISAAVKNYGTSDRNDIIASLFLDGNRIAQTDFLVSDGEETSVSFIRSVSRTGFHSGYVELSDDKFIGDNRFYFSFKIPEQFNLLIIDGDQTGGLFSLALAPSRNINQYWSVKMTDPQNLSGVNFWEYDVIIITGVPKLAETYIKRLKSFLDGGKAVFLAYGDQTDINYFNKVWSDISGIIFDTPMNLHFSRAGYYSFLSFEADHPVFSVFNFENNQPPEIKFFTLPALHTKSYARTLLQFTGERPALVETSYGEGKLLTFTGPISPLYSDITSHAFFVPFISRIAEYLAADLSSYDLHLYSGDVISRSISMKSSISGVLDLIIPDSSQYALAPEDEEGNLVLRVKPAYLPGIYHIQNPGRGEIDRFAVNINPAECDLSAVDIDQLAAALGTDRMNLITENDEMLTLISEYRYGKELWQLFLWGVVILLIFEILLARGAAPEEQ